jgi:hypothetical protein
MRDLNSYIDHVENQVCRDGFMTNVMRRHLEGMLLLAPDAESARRVRSLISRFHRPYAVSQRIIGEMTA